MVLLILASKLAAYCVDSTGLQDPEKGSDGSEPPNGDRFEMMLLALVFVHIAIGMASEIGFGSEYSSQCIIRFS